MRATLHWSNLFFSFLKCSLGKLLFQLRLSDEMLFKLESDHVHI